MNKSTALVIGFLATMLFGCGTDYQMLTTTTPTPIQSNPLELAATMAMAQVNAQATQQAVGISYTSTAWAVQVTRDVQSTQAADAATEQARHDAQATEAQSRRDAEATAEIIHMQATEERYRFDQANTQSAQATAPWLAMTMTAVYPHATLTAIAVNQQIAIATNEVEKSNLAVRRDQSNNLFKALGPYLLAIALVIGVVVWVIRKSRIHIIVGDDGQVELVVFDNHYAVRPRLLSGPAVTISADAVTMPLLTDSETQREVTRRAQTVDALKAMPTSDPTKTAASVMNSAFGMERKPYDILQVNQLPPADLIGGDTVIALEQDWKKTEEDNG
jgi:hypothetical protein